MSENTAARARAVRGHRLAPFEFRFQPRLKAMSPQTVSYELQPQPDLNNVAGGVDDQMPDGMRFILNLLADRRRQTAIIKIRTTVDANRNSRLVRALIGPPVLSLASRAFVGRRRSIR